MPQRVRLPPSRLKLRLSTQARKEKVESAKERISALPDPSKAAYECVKKAPTES
jgi:hypothetical protein